YADLIAMIVAGNLVQRVHLGGQAVHFERPLGSGEVGDLAGTRGEGRLGRRARRARLGVAAHPARGAVAGARQAPDEDVLQIAAIEEDAVVAGAGDEAEGTRVALAQ